MSTPAKLSLRNFYSCACPNCGGHIEKLSISDTENEKLQKAFNKVTRWIYKEKKTEIAADDLTNKNVQPLLSEINNILQDGFKRGITHDVPESLQRYLSENVFVFSGAKTYAELKELSDLLLDENKHIKPFYKFWQEAEAIHNDYNKAYLESEYLFATQSAQMASKWSEYEQDGDRYNLQYRTANDEKVREEHQILNNITLPFNDKFWDKYMPPNGWRCRCTTVQVRKSKYEVSDSEKAEELGEKATTAIGANGKNSAEIFRFNPGKQKAVFPKQHPYFKTLSNQEADTIYKTAAQNSLEKVNIRKYKSGGEIHIPENFSQNSQEETKNTDAYTFLAKQCGEKYKILSVINEHGVKSPDALNLKTNKFSDVKIPITLNTKTAIQNSIKGAYKQKVSEVYIYMNNEAKMYDIWLGLKASLQNGRAKSVETIIIKLKDGEVKKYDADKLRKIFKSKGKVV